jgi:hypothetical protein
MNIPQGISGRYVLSEQSLETTGDGWIVKFGKNSIDLFERDTDFEIVLQFNDGFSVEFFLERQSVEELFPYEPEFERFIADTLREFNVHEYVHIFNVLTKFIDRYYPDCSARPFETLTKRAQ